jgi:hypothetical protein
MRRIMSWFFGRPKSRTEAPQPESPREEPVVLVPRHAIALVDILNITHPKDLRGRIFHRDVLLSAIEKELKGFPYSVRRAYEFVPQTPLGPGDPSREIEEKRLQWEKLGYQFVSDRKDDVDPLIMVDMMGEIQRVMEKYRYADEVIFRVVLASGDGDYLRAIRAVRHSYAKRLRLEIVVLAWEEALNRYLKKEAGEQNIRYLNHVPGLLTENPRMKLKQRRRL